MLCDGRHVYQWLDTTGDGMILPCSSGAPGMLSLLIDPSQLLLLEQQLTRSHDGSRYDLRYEGETLHLLHCGREELQPLEFLPALQVLAADLSAARGIDTSRRRYPDFFSLMGSKMEGTVCPQKR